MHSVTMYITTLLGLGPCPLTRSALRGKSNHEGPGGGAFFAPPPCLTPEIEKLRKRNWHQTKGLDEKILTNPICSPKVNLKGQRSRSKVKINILKSDLDLHVSDESRKHKTGKKLLEMKDDTLRNPMMCSKFKVKVIAKTDLKHCTFPCI